ncbi:citrate lyase subunit alpha [Enterococcus malodoratus]|uniref:Citrate lyase alpha chain n=1 Tax=Enterococcus malodoratus ATCC 43197 TaxID=1158601 RepID=R2NM25_9ENTE|nr:citrate lyase subunit alpha [Enterococcus malodoratus]EOH72023.1 citrate lyase, alpha subunit [Enterococcus malodoratus ATCC 43197]EOT69953.1 citrate lyase, alpha subunit [Enterococcus malodoratus ATCC 43197]OJG64105.1 citrate lyase, alpha subunit [Enterococcus malodoratus]SPW74924.1 citrate lyase, alpha subunit [Enterococcus malodoratus]STD65164.1 citrate lyase, alpha subunit [Enterococcus malodoratus]
MAINQVNKEIPQEYAEKYQIYAGELAHIDAYQEASRKIDPVRPRASKMVNDLREAIEKTGLQNGMTISFHHHFREGDFVMNRVMQEIADMGFKNISIAPSSIANVHAPLIDHIKNGVVTNITSSGLRDKVGAAISEGILENPVVIRSHGGRARAIATGDLHIDVAFLGAPSSDAYGNVNGTVGKATCGSLGYAMVDAKYADKVVIITDTLMPFPNTPISIPQTDVDYVVEIDAIGDPQGIAKGATRFTKNPKELLIAEYAAKIITNSPYYKNGFSFQTGTGGASLAVSRFIREAMIKDDIKAGFALGGITNAMVELAEEGLVEKIIDVQDFDHASALSLAKNANHYEIDANMYASPLSKGSVINQLDIAILSALEIDTDYNVNVITGSDGVIRGASGGHSDTSMACQMSMIIAPLVRGRIPTVVDTVNTVVTPGTSVDVVVTELGVAINPNRQDLIEHFKKIDVPQFSIEELKEKAYSIVGEPMPIQYGDKVVALIEYRDGSIIDVVKNV